MGKKTEKEKRKKGKKRKESTPNNFCNFEDF